MRADKERLFLWNTLLILLILSVVFAVYWQSFFGYFQQDEWLSFARFIQLKDLNLIGKLQYAFAPSVGHYIPLSIITIYYLFNFFSLNYTIYAFLSLILHSIIVFLIYLLTEKIFKDNLKALLTALLFAILSAGFQANAWVLADIPVHLATIFGLFSIIYFFTFLEKNSLKHFYISIFLLIISLLFKELLIGMFIVFPLGIFLFNSNSNINGKKFSRIILLLGGFFLLFRLAMFKLTPTMRVQESFGQLSLVDTLYNILTLPFKSFVQILISPEVLVNASNYLTKFLPTSLTGELNTPKFDTFALKRTFEVVNWSLVIFFLGAISMIVRVKKNHNLNKLIVFSLALVLLNSLIFAFSPERSGVISVVDSRNLYFISLGVCILIVTLISYTVDFKKLGFTLFFVICLINIVWTNNNLADLKERGIIRKKILSQIKSLMPNLEDKTIVYTESNKSYYGLSEELKILPFQSGFGQTLLAFYYPTEKYPTFLYKDRFLWEIDSQGYKEVGNRGFGYFRDFEVMANLIQENKLPPEIIYAIRYDSDTEAVHNITDEVQGRVKSFLSNKKKIDPNNLIIKASENDEEVSHVLDSNRLTFWSSKVPYQDPQTLQIELDQRREIAMVKIDVYNNKDQNQIGYRILSSENGKDWKQVFYSKSVLPNPDGIVNIYFLPHSLKFLKINQIGFHQYAPWVVSELDLYETI